jgi:hypothetical protein
MKTSQILILVVLSLSLCQSCKEADIRLSDTSGEQIPVLGWHGLQSDFADAAHYKEMADAGFTINFDAWTSDPAKKLAMLDAAHAAGMKEYVTADMLDKFTDEQKKQVISHPALAGYHFRDEPSAKDFDHLADHVKKVQAIDSKHPCYINLFPNYANAEQLGAASYREHVQMYIAKVPVPFVSYDHYPVSLNEEGAKYLGDGFYENLEIIADEAKKAEKPFWAFAMSTPFNAYKPIPTLSDLRLQVYSDLAYGAQCIQFFTYLTPHPGAEWFHCGPIDTLGVKTDTWYVVQAMSREIKALSPVFLNARTLWTAHTGEIPKGCTEYDKSKLPKVFGSLDIAGGKGALVSQLEKGDDNFLVVVNHDVKENITVQATGAKNLRRVEKDGSIIKVNGTVQNLTPGDIVIYFWKK